MKRIAKITAIWIGIFAIIILFMVTTEIGQSVLFGGTQTAYADGFQENVFRRIKIGDTADNVRTVLGSPFWVSQDSDGHSCWVFAKSPEDSKIHNFRIRNVMFDAKGVVEKKETGIYVD